ncbi:MAG TPA: TonB-dependent receptor [Gammaproteobacteria bacterium]|nr:TonB-dependent receptor [Gammaproteobacteria bacterium]
MPVVSSGKLFLGLAALALSNSAGAHYEEFIVTGNRLNNLIGDSVSASEGTVGQEEIGIRPLARPGEVLEQVPGMVVTQHSGSGKANQYFLRGFNLDHGTDFNTTIDNMPVNLRSHGHGQGYTDLNFLIPELVQSLSYKKGPYYAAVGDFSGAGAAEFTTFTRLDESLFKLEAGQDDWKRLLLADSSDLEDGNLLCALEATRYDGPWTDLNEDLQKHNVLARRSWYGIDGQFALTFMGYDNKWDSTDQIPQRAVDRGLIDRLGSIDTSDGGESSRYSFSARWWNPEWDVSAYAIDYGLRLWSDFTFLLDDPVNGDQFEQVDERRIYGADISRTALSSLGGHALTQTFGLQARRDVIDEIGLHHTVERRRLAAVRQDAVDESSAALYWQADLQLSDRLRNSFGLRYDSYRFDVHSNLSANSGRSDDSIASAKWSLNYILNDYWNLHAGIGQGFHSNDARGTTIRVDPASGDPVEPVDPLVRSLGSEIGLGFHAGEKLNASFALWGLEQDSELLFVGDTGTTEASRASRREGYEFTAYYRFNQDWTADFEWAETAARFTEDAPGEGNHIEGSLDRVAAAGISAAFSEGWYGSLRVRHFGARTLDSFNRIRSEPSTVVNMRAALNTLGHWEFALDALNLLGSTDHEIDYFYESRLPGETGPVEDIHFHPLEPRTIRISGLYYY